MNNLREVNDDILKDWLEFREDTISSLNKIEEFKYVLEENEIYKYDKINICNVVSVFRKRGTLC